MRKIESAENILANNIDGFHRYCFASPAHPDYVSRNLCEMLGCSEVELLDAASDRYAEFVHPEDQARYHVFLSSLSEQEQRLTLQYRLISRSGAILYVQDSMTSRRNESGIMEGFSTLADVTSIKQENEALHAINETVPCGILKYTCDESPKVTYANDQMLRILRFPFDTLNSDRILEQYGQNIYLFISPEERDRFHRFLEFVQSQDKPIAGETTVLRCDGTRGRLYGWISRCVNADGKEEFQSVCMDVTDRYDRKRHTEEQRYMRALTQVYDEVTEFDLSKKTVRFLHGHYREKLGSMANMPMMMEAAAEHWLEHAVVEEDRSRVRDIFRQLVEREAQAIDDRPLQVEFRTRFSDGSIRCYLGMLLKSNASIYLFCCRNITQQQEAARLKAENTALRDISEQMQELVMQYTDGMLAFEIRGECVRPLYYSDNVCRFFGYSQEEWMKIMQEMTPIPAFVSKCHISYEVFLELLEGRDAEFNFFDSVSGTQHRYRAMRTARAYAANESYYVLLYDITSKESAALISAESFSNDVYIRTFGYFDVFVNGNPIAFRNEKAKELLALLVDRKGGFVTSSEAISALWEDEPANSVTLARYRKVALRLKNTLEEYSIADIVESVDGKRRIVTQRIGCDLYDYLSGDPQYAQLFKGSYLQNYSWGERTLAELANWTES